MNQEFKIGDRIQLIHMVGEPDMVPGMLGTVDHIDDIGQLHMIWDIGFTLALIPGEDEYQAAPR